MKRIIYLFFAIALAGVQLTSCKGKKTESTQTPTTETTSTAPVEIAEDSTLTNGVRDATKDYPGVNASVNDGEVTLTGTIERDRLPNLMESIHALHPKKVNNNLTIQ